MMHIRPVGPADAGALAELLNEIIVDGDTTTITETVTREWVKECMNAYPGQNAWHLAEDDDGTLLGIQWIEPNDGLPPEAADIATFTRKGHTGLGIGSALLEWTKRAATSLGYKWINATIRSDNTGGLIYYQSRGFETYKTLPKIRLGNGHIVEKTCKRLEL